MSSAIRPYAALSDDARAIVFATLHAAAPERWPTAAAAAHELGGPAFEGGETAFTLWDGARLRGTLAVVVREVPVKGEAFITAVTVSEADPGAFRPLLDAALARLAPFPDPVVVALGASPRPHLAALAEDAGFHLHEDALRMALRGPDPAPPGPELRFTPLAAGDPEVFRAVANAAFATSPNGATLTDAEVADLRSGASAPDLVGTWHIGATPVGFHILALDDGEGVIDTIGLVPEQQGRGLGRQLLGGAVATLRGHGADRVTLSVMSSNTPAVRLYTRHGFVREAVTARWYRRLLR